MNTLSSVNVFANDVVALSGFYADLFGFREIEADRSPIYRALDTGKSAIGFNALDAYELLELSEFSETEGVKILLTIDVDDMAEVDRKVTVAIAKGATLAKEAYKTYYKAYQAVLFDPEGNVFRINTRNLN